MSDLHIDDFYKDVALVFLKLYGTFPRKTILYVDDICGQDTPDEFGLHSNRFIAGFSTMVWLAEHNYLRFDAAIKQEALDQAVLTEQGFLLLSSRSTLEYSDTTVKTTAANSNNLLPSSVQEESRTNIFLLRQAVASGSSIMLRQCVQHLLNNK